MPVGALVKAKEWKQWFQYWRDTIPRETGWQRFLLDALALCQESCVRDARWLRSRAMLRNDHEGYSDDELHDIVENAERDLAWFERHRPGPEREAPEWAQFFFKVADGFLRSRVRCNREFRQVARKGYLTVNVNPHARQRDFLAGREDFRGVEEDA